jgi:hypothetical protein
MARLDSSGDINQNLDHRGIQFGIKRVSQPTDAPNTGGLYTRVRARRRTAKPGLAQVCGHSFRLTRKPRKQSTSGWRATLKTIQEDRRRFSRGTHRHPGVAELGSKPPSDPSKVIKQLGSARSHPGQAVAMLEVGALVDAGQVNQGIPKPRWRVQRLGSIPLQLRQPSSPIRGIQLPGVSAANRARQELRDAQSLVRGQMLDLELELLRQEFAHEDCLPNLRNSSGRFHFFGSRGRFYPKGDDRPSGRSDGILCRFAKSWMYVGMASSMVFAVAPEFTSFTKGCTTSPPASQSAAASMNSSLRVSISTLMNSAVSPSSRAFPLSFPASWMSFRQKKSLAGDQLKGSASCGRN